MPLAQPVCLLGLALLAGVVVFLTAPYWTKWIVAFYRKLKSTGKKGDSTLSKGLK